MLETNLPRSLKDLAEAAHAASHQAPIEDLEDSDRIEAIKRLLPIITEAAMHAPNQIRRPGTTTNESAEVIDQKSKAAYAEALRQREAHPTSTLAERVENMPVGTRFTETDDLGRKHYFMRVFNGVVIDNGGAGHPFTYGDTYEDGYSIEITHTSIPALEASRECSTPSVLSALNISEIRHPLKAAIIAAIFPGWRTNPETPMDRGVNRSANKMAGKALNAVLATGMLVPASQVPPCAASDPLYMADETALERQARIAVTSDTDLLFDLRALREKLGIPQSVVATRMGVPVTDVAKFERYDNNPKLSTIRRYAHAINAVVQHVIHEGTAGLDELDAQKPDSFGVLLARFSAWIDSSYPVGMDPELVNRRRIDKLMEEVGEVGTALAGWTSENPRKGITHTQADVEKELLDVAFTALSAWEHLRGNNAEVGHALARHIEFILRRVNLIAPAGRSSDAQA